MKMAEVCGALCRIEVSWLPVSWSDSKVRSWALCATPRCDTTLSYRASSPQLSNLLSSTNHHNYHNPSQSQQSATITTSPTKPCRLKPTLPTSLSRRSPTMSGIETLSACYLMQQSTFKDLLQRGKRSIPSGARFKNLIPRK